MKHGLYLRGNLMAEFATEDKAYRAREIAVEETGIIFYDVKPISFEVSEGFQIEDIDGCEFIYVATTGKAIISLETDGTYGIQTGRIEIVYPDGSGRRLEADVAQDRIDSGEWIVYR